MISIYTPCSDKFICKFYLQKRFPHLFYINMIIIFFCNIYMKKL
ncbi:hypothetical protein HMPREF1547_00679 [Blautia sp. KLE 1732]|nr:hypothetical protein HMPREF1547_00679 [Blautia sp. KLE 1732]